MGKLKRISEGKRTQAGTGGGHFRRIDTGEIITYNPDPVRSMPRVDKITGGGRTASPSLPTVSGTKGTQTDESRADAIREALVRLDAIEQTRAAAPRLTAEGLEREALEEIGREFGLDAQQTRTAYTARKALEEDLDRITNPRRKAGRAERGGKIEGAYSFGKSVEGAVVKGLEQVARFGGDTFALAEDIALAPFELLSGNDLGTFSDKGLFNWWAADIRKEQEAVEKHYAPNAARGGKAAQIFEDLGASTVAALPQAVLALLTGGGSAAAQTTAGLTGTAAQAVSPGVAATVQGAVRSMAKNPQYWTSFAQVVGSSYEDALDDMIELEAQKEMTAALIGETYEPPENQNAMRAKAALYAIGNGLMNAAVEIGGGIQTLPDQLRGGQSAWKSWVEAMVDEGKEEVVQGVIERALQNPMYGAGNPLFSTTDERAIFNPATAAQEFAGGAVVGGVLGGGQIGATRGINAAARRAAEAQARRQAETASPLPSGNRQAQGPQITQAVPAGTQNAAPEGAAVTVRKGSSALESGKGLARTLAGSIDSIRDMQPVAELTGREMNNRAKKPSEQIRDFFKRIGGTVTRSGFGAVSLGEYGVGGMLNHRPLNRAKMVSITAVPEVIQEGRQIAFDPNWKGRGYASYVFAAPVTIAGTQTYVAAVVDQRPDNKFYLSEVVDSEGNYIRIEESPSGDTKSGVTVRDGVTTTPERDSADLKESPSLDTGKAPAAAEVQSRPVEGTRPLNSDSTIAPGVEIVNRGEETRQPAAVNVAELEQSAAAAGVAEADVRAAEEISRALGREIRFYDGAQRQGPSGRANGYFDGDTIYVNSRSANPVAQIISHELTHSVEMADAYRDLSSLVFDRIQKDGGDLSQLRQEKQNLYAQNGKVLRSQEEVDREIVAEYVEHNLLTNEQEILDLTRENPTLGQRIMDWIDRLLARLGNSSAQERAFLTTARDTYARALRESGSILRSRAEANQILEDAREGIASGRISDEEFNEALDAAMERESAGNVPAIRRSPETIREEERRRPASPEIQRLREDYAAGRISDEEFNEAFDAAMEEEGLEGYSSLNQYSIDENYERDIDEWDAQGRPDGEVFVLGSTGDVLQGLGAMEQDIYLRSEKVNAILRDHPEMTLTEIKRIPEILDDPVLVLKSRNVGRGGRQNTRLVLFGTVRAENGQPVLSVLDLRPVENGLAIDDMQKVTSSYTKDSNPVWYVQNSDILHADKNRTIPLLRTIGFQMPIELQRSGSMGSISYRRQNVNMQGVPFDQVVGTTGQGGGHRYSFGGENARRADLDALDRAKDMERRGVAMETIFRETKWYTGADGKWRFEIDDSGMEFRRDGDARLAEEAEYRRMEELTDKWVRAMEAGEDLSEQEEAELERLQEQYQDRVWEEKYMLTDFLHHDELFDNYPRLRGVSLVFDGLADGEKGYFSPRSNTIVLSDTLFGKDADVLLHEIQHIIQRYEGFARGSSPSYWNQRMEEGYSKRWSTGEEMMPGELYRNTAGEIEARDVTARRHLTPEQRRQTMPNTGDENTVFAEGGDGYSMQEPDQELQDTAESLMLLGIDADTIREETGLERTEDHGWRFAVDTTPEAAYDGGRMTDQRGGLDDERAEGIRSQQTNLGRTEPAQNQGGTGRRGSDEGVLEKESGGIWGRRGITPSFGESPIHAWASEGIIKPEPGTVAYQEQQAAMEYGISSFVVRNEIWDINRGKNTKAFSVGGQIFLRETLSEQNRGMIVPHEATHVMKQTGFEPYQRFLEQTPEMLDFSSTEAYTLLDIIAERRGIDPAEMDAKQMETLFDELNATVYGHIASGTLSTIEGPIRKAFLDFDSYAAELSDIHRVFREREVTEDGAGQLYPEKRNGRVQQVPEVSQGEIQLREVPGVDSQAEASGQLPGLRAEGADGAGVNPDIRYSMDEGSTEEPSDNPLPTVEQEQGQETEQSYFDTLPRKVQSYLEGTERRLLNQLGDSLSVPRTARREYLKGITRQLTEEYLQQGRVSQETMDRLFDEAYKESKDVIQSYYNENQNLRDFLRSTKVEFTQEDAAEIPNLNDIAGRNTGILNISAESETSNIDQVYQELSERWPGIFNTWWTTTARAKLRRMVEVARSFQIAEKALSDYRGDQAADHRTWAKNDFEAAITNALGDLRNAKRYVEGRPAEDTSQAPTTMEEVAKLWADLKDARRTYERAAARNLLTDHDEVQVGRLLRGETELQYLNPREDNVRGITEVYQAKQEYERISRLLRQWNQSRKAALRQQAEQLLETANEWKDKKSGILYARETMERNIRDIVPDRQLADQIIETYFTPVHRAAADANRLKNRYRDQVRNMNLSRKVADGNIVSEAHAVQLLGEAEDNIRMIQQSRGRRKVRDRKTLEEWQQVVSDLWHNNPNLDQQKIRDAVKQFRTIYDGLFQQMNDTRVRNGYEPVNYRQGYFPHFQPGDGDGILAQFGRALGIGTEVTALPTTINGLTHAFRPGIRWFGNAQERLGFNTAYDAVEGFDRYIEGVADVIYQTDNIQRLRALATEIRYRTGDEGIRKQIDRVRDDPTLDDEDKRNRIEKIVEDGRFALSNFVVDLDEYTNLLANKKSRADRDMEQRLGRRAYNVVRALESRVAANMVAINPASWLTNFIPLTQGGALLDRGYLLRGMWETLQSYKENDGLVERSAFLTNRRGSDPILSVYEQGAEPANRAARRLRNAGIAAGRIGDVLSSPMSYIDNFTADSLVRARYWQNLAKGMSEEAALADADAFAASVMADRSKGATPTMFSRTNPVSKLFTQFQLEVNNQLSYVFKDMPREKKDLGIRALVAALLKFALGAWLYDEVYEFFIGRRPALDPVGILNDTVGDLTGWEVPNLVELGVGAATGDAPSWQVEQRGLYDTLANLGTATAEELPFIGGLLGGGRLPVGNAIPDLTTLARAATDETWAPEKRLKEAADELAKPAAYLALPFGGGQVKRVLQALDAVRKGGVYTLDAEGEEQLQYPVYNDTFQQAVQNAVMASIFGTTTLDTGRDWIESGFDTLGTEQTAAYQGMVDVGVPGEDAYALIQELQGLKADEKRNVLREADVSGEGKSVVYYGLMASDAEAEIMDALADQNADMGEVTRVLMEIKDEAKKKENGKSVLEVLEDSDLTGEQKSEIFRRNSGESKDEKISMAETYGISGGEWMEAEEGFAQEREEEEAKSLTQEIAEAVIRNMDGLDLQERAAMWQLQNKGWSWKSNPFDRKVGREIYDQLHAEDED